MSRERYRVAPVERWDSQRFAIERDRDRSRVGGERDRFEERESRFARGAMRQRERSVDGIRERRVPRGFEEEEVRERLYYDEPDERLSPRFAREPRRGRGERIAIKIERSPSPVRRPVKPILLRRQSSLDAFDRKLYSPPWREREEYGPPARREVFAREREEYRPPAFVPIPLPRSRALLPARAYEVAEPEYYGDDIYRLYPERFREREIIRTRRHRSPEEAHSARASSVSSASSSLASSGPSEAPPSEFPKRGKTRMPARLVSKKAIIELGYPFEEEDDVIIIQKALGRENIDEVIRLSEEYKSEKAEMYGGRSSAGEIIEEKFEKITQEVIEVPPPPPVPSVKAPSVKAPAPPPPATEIVEEHTKKNTTIREVSPARSYHHYQESGPIIVRDGGTGTRIESDFIKTRREREVEIRSGPTAVGALALVPDRRDARAISAEIRALEAEKEALKAERRANREIRRAERRRRESRESGELVMYEERIQKVRDPEPSSGVRIERDRKGRMSISVPKKYR